MYLDNMKQAGLLTVSEYRTCCEYINKSDVIITYSNGEYTIASREHVETFDNKPDFMQYVKTDLYWINDALKAMYSDREADGRQADRD